MASFNGVEDDLRDLLQDNYYQEDENSVVPQLHPSLPNVQQEDSLGMPIQASVQILDLKSLYDKKQKKSMIHGSRQWILDSKVNFVATANAQIVSIHIYVQRSPEAALKCNDTTGPVQLDVAIDHYDMTKTYFNTNLDSVYKSDSSSLVFDLHKIEGEIRNMFQLIIRLEFVDGTVRSFESQQFRVRTQPRKKKSPDDDVEKGSIDSPESCGGDPKRPRVESDEREPLLSDRSLSPSSVSAASGGGNEYDSSSPGGSQYNTNEVVTDYLEAQRAKIDFLKITNMVCTPKADIAYHLKMRKSVEKEEYVEGDIVGFFTSENGENEIEKLSHENTASAHMAGVISRSAYLYGNVTENDEPSDTVCVIGIVHTKVMGPVQNGERIYASLSRPGVALAESMLSYFPPSSNGKPPTLLGQALENSKPGKVNDVSLVKCFVSIVLGIQSHQVTNAVNDVRNNLDKRMQAQLENARRKSRRAWLIGGIIVFIILALLTAVLFEVFFPGSAFRYWVCRRGSIPGHTASFQFLTKDYQAPIVNGLEFEWGKLKEKLGLSFDRMNGTGIHFYLNIDRCAYGGVREVASWIDHYKQVRGAEVFAVNSTCSGVFFEVLNKWHPYTSAQNIKCVPPYHETSHLVPVDQDSE